MKVVKDWLVDLGIIFATLVGAIGIMYLASYSIAAARGEEPMVLPDSDTSSLGQETKPEESPFMIRCTDAGEFNETMKKIKAKGMVVGKDLNDKTLVMVFKGDAGSLVFARSDWQGKNVCIFGTLGEYDVDLGTFLRQNNGTSN